MRLSQLIAAIPGVTCSGGSGDPDIAAIAHDSRRVQPGSMFAAFRGQHQDGGAFIAQAVVAGASAILARRGTNVPAGIRCVFTDDERRAAALLAARLAGDPAEKLVMVGITGTSGKTTTSLLVERIVQDALGTCGLFGTLVYRGPGVASVEADRTTPEATDLQPRLSALVRAGAAAAVMECSSHALALERLAGCRFDAAAFMNLSRDHLDYHRDFDDYFAAKSRLFDLLKPGGAAVINIDDARGALLAERLAPRRCVRFSLRGAAGADVLATAEIRTDATIVRVRTPVVFSIVSPLLGAPNAENLLAAAAIGIALGVAPASIAASLAAVDAIPGRLERVPNSCGVTTLVDYAHKPAALEGVLRTARSLAGARGKVLLVVGCGGDRDRGKRPEMGAIAARQADVVILTSDNPRSEDPDVILAEIDTGVRAEGRRATILPDRATAIREAVRIGQRGDVVIIAGKGHETYQELSGRKEAFDDRVVARAAFAARESAPGASGASA